MIGAVEDHQNLLPLAVHALIIHAGHNTVFRQFLHPQNPLMGIGGFILDTGHLHPQTDQAPVIIHQTVVFPGTAPIQLVDFAAGAVAVLNAALGTAEFLTSQEEGTALAAEIDGSSQTVRPQDLLLAAGIVLPGIHGGHQLIPQGPVIMAA